MARALFVVSTGRTGTTFLTGVLREAGARSYHEPGPAVLRNVAHAYAAGRLSDRRARALLHRWRDDALADRTVPYAENSTLVYGLVKPLFETFDDIAVAHVVRDPLSYIRSGKNWGQYRFAGRPKNLLPFRRLAPPQYDPWSPRARIAWMLEDQFERLCWAWTHMNRAVRTQGSGRPGFRTVRFEDMVDPVSGPAVVADLLATVGLDLAPARLAALLGAPVNVARRKTLATFPDWPEWSRAQLEHVLAVCAPEAAHYGYDLAGRISARRADVDVAPA